MIVPAIWAAVMLLWFFTIGAEIADSQPVEPKVSLLDTACTTAAQIATLGGVNVEKCRLVAQDDAGQTAYITVKVKVTGQGWFSIALAYQRTVWAQSGIQITPIP